MPEKKKYVSVILPLKLDWLPCYSVPAEEEIRSGDRVKVVFANKSYSGIIAGCDIRPDTDPARIKDVTYVDRNLSPVTQEEIRLWKMVADYYLCSVGEVFKAAYPALKISQEEALARRLESERARRRKTIEGIRLKIARLEDNLYKKKKKLEESEKSSRKKEKTVARIIEDIGKINEMIIGLKGRLEEISEAGPESGTGIGPEDREDQGTEIRLTEAQETTYRQTLEAFGEGKPVLIKGVTGSGKTEIYLKLARKAMSEGKNVLYLVP